MDFLLHYSQFAQNQNSNTLHFFLTRNFYNRLRRNKTFSTSVFLRGGDESKNEKSSCLKFETLSQNNKKFCKVFSTFTSGRKVCRSYTESLFSVMPLLFNREGDFPRKSIKMTKHQLGYIVIYLRYQEYTLEQINLNFRKKKKKKIG